MTMKIFGWAMLIAMFLIVISIGFSTCNTAGNMAKDGLKTIENQYKPSELLRKYEWFKDASASCDEKLATLKVYESRFEEMKADYHNTPRKEWAREDKEQWNIWQSEYTGLKASYNELSAQYNSSMVKFNYAFCNKGTLPQGAEVPLPREYKPYLTE